MSTELYWNKNHTAYAVLVSSGFGAGWSTWNTPELAYDARVVKFWLDHKDNDVWMREVGIFRYDKSKQSFAHNEAEEFFKSIGYEECPYLGGFYQIHIEWIASGEAWIITEYDGSETLKTREQEGWNIFY